MQYSTHNVGRYWDGYNPIEDVFSFPRSIEHLFKGYESQIMGMQYSLWTERVADVKMHWILWSFQCLIALAEACLQTAGRKDYSGVSGDVYLLPALAAYERYLLF